MGKPKWDSQKASQMNRIEEQSIAEYMGKTVSIRVKDADGNTAYLIWKVVGRESPCIEHMGELEKYGVDIQRIVEMKPIEILGKDEKIHMTAIARGDSVWVKIPKILYEFIGDYKYITVMKKNRVMTEPFSPSEKIKNYGNKRIGMKTVRWLGLKAGDIITVIFSKNDIERKNWKVEVEKNGRYLKVSHSIEQYGIGLGDYVRVGSKVRGREVTFLGQVEFMVSASRYKIVFPYEIPCISNHVRIAKIKTPVITTYIRYEGIRGIMGNIYFPQLLANFFGVKDGDSLILTFENGMKKMLELKRNSTRDLRKRYKLWCDCPIIPDETCGVNMVKVSIRKARDTECLPIEIKKKNTRKTYIDMIYSPV